MNQLFSQYGCDAILITNLSMIRFITGFKGEAGTLLILKNKNIFFTDGRFTLEAEREIKNAIIIDYDRSHPLWGEKIPQVIKEYKICRLGYFEDDMSVPVYHKLLGMVFLIPIDGPIAKYRAIKTKDEISKIKEAVRISENAFQKTLELIVTKPTEKELAAYFGYQMLLMGAEKPAFDTVVAFGENSLLPHAIPSLKQIKGNGFLVFDFGVTYKGYKSDETVTLFIGKPNKEQTELYEHVLSAQKKMLDAVKPGIKASKLQKVAVDYLEERGYGKYIKHAFGHGIGIDIHEFPSVNGESQDIIEPGMVVAIEPGIYVPEIGGVRLEETLLVSSSGCEILTTIPKELKIIF